MDGKVLPPDDFDAQAKMVMGNLTKALAAGGAKIADVTKITIFICNPHDVSKARGILQTYFAGAAPRQRVPAGWMRLNWLAKTNGNIFEACLVAIREGQ